LFWYSNGPFYLRWWFHIFWALFCRFDGLNCIAYSTGQAGCWGL
jgi:hypothetical protein